MEKVRGTQENVSTMEIGKTTIFMRKNIKRIESEEFSGWEYDEVQMSKDEFIAYLQSESESVRADMSRAIVELTMLIATGGEANV